MYFGKRSDSDQTFLLQLHGPVRAFMVGRRSSTKVFWWLCTFIPLVYILHFIITPVRYFLRLWKDNINNKSYKVELTAGSRYIKIWAKFSERC
jgi:hypothetical protein